MALAEDDFEQIKSRVRAAYEIEEPVVQKFREFAKRLKNKVKQIRPYSANAVSFVSTDGGDNRLYFNPAVIELIRVVDSQGKQCALDAIAGNTKYDSLNAKIESVPPLKRLCEATDKNIIQLSHFLKGLGEPGKTKSDKIKGSIESAQAAMIAYAPLVGELDQTRTLSHRCRCTSRGSHTPLGRM